MKLPKGKAEKLVDLKENEEIFKLLSKKYDPRVIEDELLDIDIAIEQLRIKRKGVEYKLEESPTKLVELANSLKENSAAQNKLLVNPNLLARLLKAKKFIADNESVGVL